MPTPTRIKIRDPLPSKRSACAEAAYSGTRHNEVERNLRTWVLDRKTWLFCGHDESARRAADAMTIITTCKKLGIDPRSYMRDTLERILAGEKDLASLLPENYKPALAEQAPAALGLAA